VFQQVLELLVKLKGLLGGSILLLQINVYRHQRFSYLTSAELAEMAALVRLVAEGIGLLVSHGLFTQASRAAWQKAIILSTSFTPGALSTPLDVSTSGALVWRIAFPILAALSPPARPQGALC